MKNNQTSRQKVSLRRRYINNYWQLYLMMVLPLIYFILFKYVPMFGNVLAFRRFRPLTGPYGVRWEGFRYFEMFLKDQGFLRAFRNTLELSILNLIINFPHSHYFCRSFKRGAQPAL